MTSCPDCPYLSNGTRKRPICCMETGLSGHRGGRVIVDDVPGDILPERSPVAVGLRARALGGSVLGSALVGGFAPEVWDGRPRFAAPLTPKEAVQATMRRIMR